MSGPIRARAGHGRPADHRQPAAQPRDRGAARIVRGRAGDARGRRPRRRPGRRRDRRGRARVLGRVACRRVRGAARAGRPGAPRAGVRRRAHAWPPCRCRPSPRSRATPWAAASSSPCAATCGSPRSGPGSGCPEVRLAVTPGAGGTQRLPRVVGAGPGQGADPDRQGPDRRRGRADRPRQRGRAGRRGRRRGDAPSARRSPQRGPLAVREAKRLIDLADRDRHRRPAWRPRSTPRIGSSPPTTCSRAPRPSSRSATRTIAAAEAVTAHGGDRPWPTSDGSGSSCRRTSGRATARSARAASRRSPARVEELGFDSLFITDHLLVGKRFYSVNWLEPLTTLAVAAGATERVRLGHVDPDHAAAQPGHPRQGARDPPVPVSDNRVILGAGVGWNDAEYEAVGVHKSERGKRTDEMLDIMMPLLEGETVTYHGEFYSVDDVFIEPRTSQRPLLWIGGGSQLADPKSPDVPQVRRVGQAPDRQGRRLDPAPDLPAAGHRPRLGTSSRRLCARPARTRRDTLVAHENFLHLVLTDDPAEGAPAAARGVPQGDERRARTGVPRVGLPVRDAGRGHRLAPGAGRRRRRVLLPAHDDARPGAAPAVGRPHHPERRLPGDRRAGPPPADALAVGDDPSGRRCSASRSSDATRRSCTTPRSTRPASTRATCCWSSRRTRSRRRSPRRAGRTGWASA